MTVTPPQVPAGVSRLSAGRDHPLRLLDLFCGAGGAARGYQQAGFHVVGVDIKPQPRYAGDQFMQGDAMEYVSAHGHEYDAIHASPPCQTFARVTAWRGSRANHTDLLAPTLAALARTPAPWVVENVPEAPLRADLILCGTQFGLTVRRHRVFQLGGWSLFELRPPCHHPRRLLPFEHKAERAYADAMGCQWMSNREARQAIPPAYTQWIGQRLAAHLAATHPTDRRSTP